jgi:hypothetical protein
MTAQSQLEQERIRAKLVLDQENARARITAYQTLSAKLDDLDQAFLSYLIFVQWAADHGMDAATRRRVDEQLKEVGKKERLVTAAQTDPLLGVDPLRSDIDECLTKLVAVMSAARQKPTSALQQRALEKDLKRLRSEAAEQASQVSIP